MLSMHTSTSSPSCYFTWQSKDTSRKRWMYFTKSSSICYLVPCKLTRVIFSSTWKYLLQKLSTISSQVLIDPAGNTVYQVYALSTRDFENSRRQRSPRAAKGPMESKNLLMCSMALPFLPSNRAKVGVSYFSRYGSFKSSMG
jgi:hypothetical protein